jgi:uncharacterized Zn-finger protein
MLPKDVISDLYKIGQDLNQIKSNLEDGFKIFSKYLCGFDENICSRVNLNLTELISGGHSFMKGIDSLEDLKKEYEDAHSKSFQPDTFCLLLNNMLQHLNNLQSNYEDGTNVFRRTFFTLKKQQHNIVHLDLQHLDHGLDIFHKGSDVLCSLQTYIESLHVKYSSLQSKLNNWQDQHSGNLRKKNGKKSISSYPEFSSEDDPDYVHDKGGMSDQDSDFELPGKYKQNGKVNKILPVPVKFEESNDDSIEYNISMMPPDEGECKEQLDLDNNDISKERSATIKQKDGPLIKKRRSKKLKRKTGSDDKIFNCRFCNAPFVRRDKLNEHLRIHTGERPYKCDYCDKSFPRKDGLRFHRMSHTGDKPHECDICHKSFIRKDKLVNHLRTHSGEKPFKCDVCHKWFSRKDKLSAHRKIHLD